jgi:hypothetical protein
VPPRWRESQYIAQDDSGASAGRQQPQGGDEGERAVVPGSARILESVGDECNALILVTVETDFGGTKTTLPAARIDLLDDNHKIKSEQVVCYVSQG